MSWQGKFRHIPDEEELLNRFWVKHYVHPLLFPEIDFQTVAEERATKLCEWLDHRYPCKCQCCGYEMEDRENWSEIDTILCDECTTCYSCGKLIHEDNSHYTSDDHGPYCSHCYEGKFITCSACEESCGVENTYSHGSYVLCYDCNNTHIFCDDCGCIVHEDNVYFQDEDSDRFCKSCFQGRYPPTELPSFGEGVSNGLGRQALEKGMALVVLRYYAAMATNLEWGSQEQFRLTEIELKTISQYFVTTAAAELRHATKCKIKVDDYWCLRILHTHCNSENWRQSSSRDLVMGSTSLLDMNINDTIKFLRSAYVVFYSEAWKDLEGSFGGKNWANCCLQAVNLLSALNSRNGYADNLLWEMCLNASHNNSNWLSKVPGETGILWVLYVLNMGAKSSPKQILDIYHADDPFKALPCDGTPQKTNCDFSRLPDPESVWFYDDGETKTIPEFAHVREQSKPVPITKSVNGMTIFPTPGSFNPVYVKEMMTTPFFIHAKEKGDSYYDYTELEKLYSTISIMQTTPGLATNRPI